MDELDNAAFCLQQWWMQRRRHADTSVRTCLAPTACLVFRVEAAGRTRVFAAIARLLSNRLTTGTGPGLINADCKAEARFRKPNMASSTSRRRPAAWHAESTPARLSPSNRTRTTDNAPS